MYHGCSLIYSILFQYGVCELVGYNQSIFTFFNRFFGWERLDVVNNLTGAEVNDLVGMEG